MRRRAPDSPDARAVALALAVAAALAAWSGPATAVVRQVPSEYATIQAAVDAALPGDEVLVAAGTYEEQVLIAKNLTLTGAGSGQTILQAPVTMPYEIPPLNYNAVVFALQPATTVVLRDLSIEGAGRGRPGTRFVGAMYERVGGEVRRLGIGGIHDTPVGDTASGIGLYVRSDPGDGLSFLAEDVLLDRFQKSGFAVFGSGCALDLRRVTADAGSMYSDAVQNAFELANATSGTLTDCAAIGAWYDGDPIANTTACGFLFYYADAWTVNGLVADGNQSGIYGIATDLAIEGATVMGHAQPLGFNYGIVASGPGAALLAGSAAPGRPRPLEAAVLPLVSPLGTEVTLADCTIVGEKLADSIGVVHFSMLEEVALDVSASTISDWDIGLLAAEVGDGWVTGRARSTSFRGQTGPAILGQSFQPFDARGNHWDDPTGPFEPTLNPGGLGQAVSGNVFFTPWLQGNVVCTPLPLYIAAADDDGAGGHAKEITVRYLGGAANPVYGFSAELTWNPGKISATVADVSRPDSGPFATATLFQVLPLASGVRVDAALGGAQPGASAGDLCRIRFHLVGEPDYSEIPIDLVVRHLRDGSNADISGYLADDGLVIGDVVPPVIGELLLTNVSLAHTDAFAKNGDVLQIKAPVSDGDPVFGAAGIYGNMLMLFGVPGYLARPDSYGGGTANWPDMTAVLVPADGPVPWSVTATDPAGNVATRVDTLWADNTPPLAVGGLSATTGADRIDLAWDDPAGLDANLRHLVVRSAAAGDYPFYLPPWPAYPGGPTAGNPVYTGLGTGTPLVFPADGSGRDVFSFQVFAVDMVGLVSPGALGAQQRARNYRLADVAAAGPPYDNQTDSADLARLDGTWGRAAGDPAFDPECDVGPTDTGQVAGLPLPDGVIDLDDLMVFAQRYGGGPGPTPEPTANALAVDLAWSRPAPATWVLTLQSPCPVLKGLRLVVDLPDGVTATAAAGALLAAQDDPVYLRTAGSDLDATWAVLGPGEGLAGAGELLRITLSAPLAVPSTVWDARSIANTPLPVQDTVSAVPTELPVAFALHGNHPNPFNPSTRIAFDLPSRQHVRLVVYGVDGRRVATVVEAELPAGRHAPRWRGQDARGRSVATGTYLYRLEAGPWTATGKMNLIR